MNNSVMKTQKVINLLIFSYRQNQTQAQKDEVARKKSLKRAAEKEDRESKRLAQTAEHMVLSLVSKIALDVPLRVHTRIVEVVSLDGC